MSTSDLEWEDTNLSPFGIHAVSAVQLLDDGLNLRQHLRVRGDNERVGLWISRDVDGLGLLFLNRPLVVLTHQRCCQIHSISIAKLENAQRRHVLRLRLIETPNKCANDLVLFTAGGDQNGIGALDGIQHRRRTTPTAYRRKLTLR